MRVSVVTISFNQGRYLERAIRSVVEQDYTDVEYIVIDAASSDGSIDVLKRWNDRITYWCSEPDDGPAAGLNKGFRHATGDIFAYINADDFFLPGAFSRIIAAWRQLPAADVIYGHGWLVDESGVRVRPIYSDKWSLGRYAAGACVVVQQATFVKGSAFREVGGFNESNGITWDGELLVDMSLRGCRFHRIPALLGAFRLHQRSITGRGLHESEAMEREQRRIAEKIREQHRCRWTQSHHGLAVLEKRVVDPVVSAKKAFGRMCSRRAARFGRIRGARGWVGKRGRY